MKDTQKRPPGRPKRAEPPKERLQVPLDKPVIERIKAHAAATGQTVAEVARKAIDKGLPLVMRGKP